MLLLVCRQFAHRAGPETEGTSIQRKLLTRVEWTGTCGNTKKTWLMYKV